ncbi:MAG: ASKHA domain-containing protein [Candidatus Omnitrophota bacterium]
MTKYILLIDIGTTTISGAIFDKEKGRVLSSDFILNEQIRYGDDVISRIDHALRKIANAASLQRAVVLSINKLSGKLFSQAKKSHKDIGSAFCVCNTAIHHLFLGIDTAPLITPPYKPSQKSEITIYADRIGLKLEKDCPVTLLPNVEGFVGSDALAVIIASGIYKSRAVKLAIDMGTNGEVVLGSAGRIFAASAAAGPAFEGRHISCGMPAIKGAIKSIEMKGGSFKIDVIGGGAPKGICGSALIDAASCMLKNGLMNSSGRMNEPEFVFYKKGRTKISVTQQDIRKLQLAKAAIYAAVKILLRKSRISKEEITEVLFTGSFGSVVNTDSIAAIGLVPKIDKRRIRFLEKGALEGLKIYAGSLSLQKKITSILSSIKHIPLLGKGFSEEFTSSMFLG